MTTPDEPLFDSDEQAATPSEFSPSIANRVRRLVREEPYAVLCLQGEGQPYGALVAFAFTEDLRHAVFATPVATRKYRLLTRCDHVALVIDNRPKRKDGLMEIEAVTVTGRARLVERHENFQQSADILIGRHPYLESFVRAASCALFRVEVVRYFHVIRFQEVYQWSPGKPS